MGTMPGWYAKPYEFYLFDEFFSSREELVKMRDGLDANSQELGSNNAYWNSFWGSSSTATSGGTGSSGDLKASKDHFFKHWLDPDPKNDFFDFPRDPEEMRILFQRAFGKAAAVALDGPGPPKRLALTWQCTAGTKFIGIGVADGPHVVSINITTPPYRDDAAQNEQNVTAVRDRAWTFVLGDPTVEQRSINLIDGLKDSAADLYPEATDPDFGARPPGGTPTPTPTPTAPSIGQTPDISQTRQRS